MLAASRPNPRTGLATTSNALRAIFPLLYHGHFLSLYAFSNLVDQFWAYNFFMARGFVAVAASLLLASSISAQSTGSNTRPRDSDLGLKIGILPTRLAARAWLGMARTGSAASNGSGDYAIAFSTAPQLRIHTSEKPPTRHVELLTNDAMSPLFLAVIEATEEAIYNSMFRATTMSGNGHMVEELPIDKTIEILRKHRSIR
jgi:hypothetical protein